MQLVSKPGHNVKTPLRVQKKSFFFRILNRVNEITARIHLMLGAALCRRKLIRTGQQVVYPAMAGNLRLKRF
jgi:hypothetical protein